LNALLKEEEEEEEEEDSVVQGRMHCSDQNKWQQLVSESRLKRK
jgi:hypothetical protein